MTKQTANAGDSLTPQGDGAPDFTEISPEAMAAGVAALNACVSDAQRILPDEEIVGRKVRAIRKNQGTSRRNIS
jgi:hypothetical protein